MTHRMPTTESQRFFSHLKPPQFEELCFDLVIRMGFERVTWRKGSSGEYSPSDGSRDIEAYWVTNDPDESRSEQLWVIDAKHVTSSQALNRTKISDFLSLRSTRNGPKFLVMTSGHISNPLRDEIAELNLRGPSVRFWERHHLISFISRYHELLHKYDISNQLSWLIQLHPYHVLLLQEHILYTDQMFVEFVNMAEQINFDAMNHLKFELFGIEYLKNRESFDIRSKYYELKQVLDLLAVKIIIERFFQIALRNADDTRIEWQRGVHKTILEQHPEWSDGIIGDQYRGLDGRVADGRKKYVASCDLILPAVFEMSNAELEILKQPSRG